MRGNVIDLLMAEAKRKPEIKALVDNIHNLTDEDIAQAKVPLPWYRQALKLLRAQDSLVSLASDVDKHTVHGVVPNPDGEVFWWTGDDQYVPSGPFYSQLMVTNGKLLWLPKNGGVWIDTSFTPSVDHLILINSRKLCNASKMEYMDMCKRARSCNASDDTPVTDISTSTPSPLASLGVRIYR